jgi:hypothetical protein
MGNDGTKSSPFPLDLPGNLLDFGWTIKDMAAVVIYPSAWPRQERIIALPGRLRLAVHGFLIPCAPSELGLLVSWPR